MSAILKFGWKKDNSISKFMIGKKVIRTSHSYKFLGEVIIADLNLEANLKEKKRSIN